MGCAIVKNHLQEIGYLNNSNNVENLNSLNSPSHVNNVWKGKKEYISSENLAQKNKINELETQADSCSQIATIYQQSLMSKLLMNYFENDENIFTLLQTKTQKQKRNEYIFTGPAFIEEYTVVCEEKNLSLYLHLFYGFMAENLCILTINKNNRIERQGVRERYREINENKSKENNSKENKSKETKSKETNLQQKEKQSPKSIGIIGKKYKQINKINNEKYIVYAFLKSNVSIFTKLKLECPKCLKWTLVTKCKPLFVLDDSMNCQCLPTYVNFKIIELEPELAKIYSEEHQKILSVPSEHTIKINVKSQIRVLGCCECMGFEKLKRKNESSYVICSKCSNSGIENNSIQSNQQKYQEKHKEK